MPICVPRLWVGQRHGPRSTKVRNAFYASDKSNPHLSSHGQPTCGPTFAQSHEILLANTLKKPKSRTLSILDTVRSFSSRGASPLMTSSWSSFINQMDRLRACPYGCWTNQQASTAPKGPLHLSHSITLARLLDKTPSRYSKIYWAVWKYEFEFVKLNIPNPEQFPIGPNTLIGDNVRFIQSTWLRVASLGLRRASLAKGHGEQRQMRPVRYDSIDEQTSPFWGFTRIYQVFALLYNLARVRGARLMKGVLAISASIVAIMTILAFGEPTIQRSIGDGARAQHSTKVRDQACYRRCRNDMRKPTSACNRLCRSSRD
jgi:hypothetical protein